MEVVLQVACVSQQIPDINFFEKCIANATNNTSATVTVRIVEADESQQLNSKFRGKDKPTNVLSFPDQPIPGEEKPELGALVFCADVINTEIKQQNAGFYDYWAHMIIHGCLHLLGFTHDDDKNAHTMESAETAILVKLGYTDPYKI
jgi:probable rRNA maturation factor